MSPRLRKLAFSANSLVNSTFELNGIRTFSFSHLIFNLVSFFIHVLKTFTHCDWNADVDCQGRVWWIWPIYCAQEVLLIPQSARGVQVISCFFGKTISAPKFLIYAVSLKYFFFPISPIFLMFMLSKQWTMNGGDDDRVQIRSVLFSLSSS